MGNYNDEGYNNAMDREEIIPMNQIGTSTNPFQHQTEALKAKIFHGASRVEFSFMGAGKSDSQNPSPEAFGKQEREDMRALAEYNNVQTSTHASVRLGALSGLNQNRFSEDARKNSIDELKRAIDFASEASTGGAVVFHAGEAPRSMNTTFGGEFKMHDQEDKLEVHYLASRRKRALVSDLQDDTKIFLPKLKRDDKGNTIALKNDEGNEIIDNLTGEKLYEFETDPVTDEMSIEEISFKNFKEDKLKQELGKDWVNADTNKKRDVVKKAAIDYFKKEQFQSIQYQLGMSREAERNYSATLNYRNIKLKEIEHLKKLKEKLPASEWEKQRKENEMGELIDPIEDIRIKLRSAEGSLERINDQVAAGKGKAMEILADFKSNDFVAAEDLAHEKAVESMTEAAMYAHEKTQQRVRMGDALIKKNPLYISPESYAPEQYGGHPDEIIKLVTDSRSKLSEELQRVKSISKSEADKVAKQHIKATLDVGHLNIWKKYYTKKDGETQEDYDGRFKNWFLKKSKELTDTGVLGHVHLSDNFGYHDEHLSIGEGNVPVKEALKIFKKGGIEEFIAEPGSFNANTALPDAWEFLGSPVYSIFRPGITGQTWGDGITGNGFSQSYFGRTESAKYIFGEYAPSDDFRGSPFYSGTPLE